MANFLNTVVLLAALQGFIVCILLYRRRSNKQADRLLATLILLMSMCSLNLYFFNTQILETTKFLRIVSYVFPLVIVMPIGPLIYFYIKTIIDPSFTLTPKRKRIFWTAIIDIIPELTAIIFFAGASMKMIWPNPGPWGLFIDSYNRYVDIPRWASITLFVWLSYKYIKSKKAEDPSLNKSAAKLKWLTQFITIFLVFQAVWLIYLVPYILPKGYEMIDRFGWYPIYIPMAIMIYWLGLKGYLVGPELVNPDKRKGAISSGLSASVVHQTSALLKKAMEGDKLYLNPLLNLDTVATHTGLSAKTISVVLNRHLQTSFAEWVNGYRVEEFKQRVREADLRQLTISGIALNCGFNSQATFQRIFKQVVGMTPTEYLKIAV